MGKQSPKYRVAALGAPEFIAGAGLTGLLASTVLAPAVVVTRSLFGRLNGLLVRRLSIDATPRVEY